MTVKNVVRDATDTDTKTMGEVFQRIVRFNLVPETSDIFTVERSEFTTSAVKEGGGQSAGRNKERVAFDQH